MFIYQIPGSNCGIISTPPPEVVTLSHSPFPIFPIDWTHEGELALFSPPLLCTTCDVLGTVKQREFGWTCFIVGRDLKQRSSLLCPQWKEWKTVDSVEGFFVFPDLFWQLRKFHCQRLLIRSVTGRMYGPALVHLAFV